MVKISSNSEMVPRENSPNLVKLAWNDPISFSVAKVIKNGLRNKTVSKLTSMNVIFRKFFFH